MYTLEEIEEEAKATKWKVWRWSVLAGLALLALFILVLLPAMVDSYNPYGNNFFYYFEMICMLIATIGIFSLPEIAYKRKKKQMTDENAEEERIQREEHYRKLEELVEKIAKEKE